MHTRYSMWLELSLLWKVKGHNVIARLLFQKIWRNSLTNSAFYTQIGRKDKKKKLNCSFGWNYNLFFHSKTLRDQHRVPQTETLPTKTRCIFCLATCSWRQDAITLACAFGAIMLLRFLGGERDHRSEIINQAKFCILGHYIRYLNRMMELKQPNEEQDMYIP